MNKQLKKIWAPLMLVYGTFVFMQITTWIPLRYWKIWGGGNFVDSGQILRWADCYGDIGNLIFESTGVCSGYLYGSTLVRILSFFSLSPTNTQVLGYVFMLLLATAISFSLYSVNSNPARLFLFSIVFSPPILLLAERGNFDIVMAFLVITASILYSKNYQILALLPLALATLLKFYTLPLFLLFLILNQKKKQRIVTILVGAIVSTRVFLDLKLIKSSFPSEFSGQFGASIWSRYFKQLNVQDLGVLVNNVSGLAILIVVIVLTLVVLKRLKMLSPEPTAVHRNERVLFYSLFSTHVSCYLFGMSIDYRLIFLSLASLIYLRHTSQQFDLDSRTILVLAVMSVWLTFPSSGLEPFGDIATEVLTVILGIRFIQLMKIDLESKNAI
jgi:hypothetical protein